MSQEWHISRQGKRYGPFDTKGLKQLARTGELLPDDLVWRDPMSEWVRANHVKGLFPNPAPQQPPLVAKSPPPLPPARTPPPLPGSGVSNGIIWTVAFAPIIGTILEHSVAAYFNTDAAGLSLITFGLNSVLCSIDDHYLKQSGIDSTFSGWWVFIVPVYLFKRAKALGQSLSYFATWMGCAFLSLFL